jgi:hypothetical protein
MAIIKQKTSQFIFMAHPAILWVKMRNSWFLKPKLNLGQLIENEAN